MTKEILTLGILGHGALSQATVLTFDITGNSNGNFLDQGYGDNVAAATVGNFGYDISNGTTPDVTVDYSRSDSGSLSWWSTGCSDLTNVIYNENDGDPLLRITFTASNNQNVVLNSFDIGNFGGAVTLPGLSLKDGNGLTLVQLIDVPIPSFSSPASTFIIGGFASQVLVLELDLTGLGGNSDNIGLDNISFSQEAVPEPATMLGLAAVGAWFACRKRS
ncbi:hypothetical protein CCB80_07410 [Armatimonadetes bacterium Uphvl-Ar1]|nr:hypothetical protein CCB80_07410 [Armatimonadetes bacterium Uphvl-Ar1]